MLSLFRDLFVRDEPGVRQILLHHHLFKNAGTTIDWALKRSFGQRFFDHRYDGDMADGGMPYLQGFLAGRPRLAAISSHHMPFDPDFQAPGLVFWDMFLLRDPIARALSVYRYEKTQPARASLGAKMAKQFDMQGYFEWRLSDDSPPVLRNFHARSISGLRGKRYEMKDSEVLERALSRAMHPRVLIGFVERFDESMVLFEHVLRRPFEMIDLTHIVQNKSNEPATDPAAMLRSSLGETTYARLLEKNALDMRLYETLSREFDARIAAMNDFDRHLSAYKDRCA